MIAEHIKSFTYAGKGKEGGVLVITPGEFSKHDKDKDNYNEEAERIYRFLLSVFCNETMKKLKEKITV